MGSSSNKRTKQTKNHRKSKQDLVDIDPNLIYFQHSRIRPVFSGCGRTLEDTLQQLQSHRLSVSDLPPIQVIQGESNNKEYYFSLNNRRLWVFKQLRQQNALQTVPCRVRSYCSTAERQRYNTQNCVLHAKVMRETRQRSTCSSSSSNTCDKNGTDKTTSPPALPTNALEMVVEEQQPTLTSGDPRTNETQGETSSDDNDTDNHDAQPNRFGALHCLDDNDDDTSSDDDK